MQFVPKSDCKLLTKSVKMPTGNTIIFQFIVGFVNPLIPLWGSAWPYLSALEQWNAYSEEVWAQSLE